MKRKQTVVSVPGKQADVAAMPIGSEQSDSWSQAERLVPEKQADLDAEAEFVVGDGRQMILLGDRCEVRVRHRQSRNREVRSMITIW